MELSQYIEKVREDVARMSSLADENTQQVAQKLSASLDSALRLSLIEALSDAAAEISAELAPTSVEVRIAGSNPEFTVHQVTSYAATEADLDDTEDEDLDSDADSDEPQARISLRLPASVKKRIDELADEDQISTNAWITRALLKDLRRGSRRGGEWNRGEWSRGEDRPDGRGRGRGRRGRGRGGWDGPAGPQWPGHPGPPWGPGRPPFPPGPPMTGGWGQNYQGWV